MTVIISTLMITILMAVSVKSKFYVIGWKMYTLVKYLTPVLL